MPLASGLSWSSLPSDLLCLVFLRLPPRDLLAAAAVCRAWQRAATADIVWAPHLAARVAPPQSSEVILATQRLGALAPIPLREQYALCLQMGSWAITYCPESGLWRLGNRSAPHLEIIRDAAQLGFDPLRHMALSWANALRLVRLWAVRGTLAVAAVAATCAQGRNPVYPDDRCVSYCIVCVVLSVYVCVMCVCVGGCVCITRVLVH